MANFEGDAFISYAHLDNIGLAEGHKGWVANLQRALQIRVAQLLGKEARIWWDPKLHGNDVFADTLIAQLQRVSALISVVSPRYIRSEWTLREIAEFCRAAERQGGIHIRDKSRIFKVLKTPVPLDQHPRELQSLLGYEFFKVDPVTGRIRELDQIFGPEAERDFWIKLDDLAHDVCALLELLRAAEPQPAVAEGTVYLAETTSDLRAERDAVRRGLQQQGYSVLPSRATPLAAAEAVPSVREDLARSRMSIHMFGRNYGFVPEGGTASLLEIQNELAVERAAQGAFARLVWIPAGVAIEDPRQRAVVERLRMDQRVQENADLLETSLEDLQTLVDTWLRRGPRSGCGCGPWDSAPRERISTVVYLVYDLRDMTAIEPWADFLFKSFEVVHPCFDGDEAEIRGFHEETLQNCDGVLILHGAASQAWLRRKLAEVQKSAAFGRPRGAPEVAICLLPPETADKARFRTHLANVVNQTGGFDPSPLQPFVDAVQARTAKTGGRPG